LALLDEADQAYADRDGDGYGAGSAVSLWPGAGGCIRTPVQLADATSHLEVPRSFEKLGPATGKACQFNLYFLFPLAGNQLWKAKERAVGDADGLLDVSVDESFGFAVIGTSACTQVRGVRYRLLARPPAAAPTTALPPPEMPPAPQLPADPDRPY
jgi:hypothetical protein